MLVHEAVGGVTIAKTLLIFGIQSRFLIQSGSVWLSGILSSLDT